MSVLAYLRQPIFYLRKTSLFRRLSRLPITVPVRWSETGYIVYADLFRNLRFVADGDFVVEPEECNCFRSLIHKFRPNVFWDVGSNIGYYSFLFLSHVQNGSVLAFEPDPRNVELLRRTTRRNAIQSLEIVTKAVDKQAGEADFFLDDLTGASGSLVSDYSFISDQYGHIPQRMRILTTTLDEQFSVRCSGPDLMKIDVEGADLRVLEGGRHMLETCHPIVMYEATHFEETREFFQRLGYDLFDVTTLRRIDAPAFNVIALHRKHLAETRDLL
jgi:FkbM family methyltransferase